LDFRNQRAIGCKKKQGVSMNAFHPDYIKTYHPNFITNVRTESSQIEHGKINGKKARHTRESVSGFKDIKSFPETRRRR